MTGRLATPLDASVTPEFFFDASVLSTYTLDGDGKVAARIDVSGKSVVAEAEAGKRPLPVSAGSARFPLQALSYDGAIEFAPVRITGTKLTAFLVVRIVANGSAYDRVISYGRRGSVDYGDPGAFDVELHPCDPRIRLQRNGGLDATFDIAKPAVLEAVFDGSQGCLFLNGHLWVTLPSSGRFDIATTAFGGSIMNGSFLRSIQGAQLVYADALNEADRALVRGALAWQWDGGAAGTLVAQLPANDPYKNAPPVIVQSRTRRRRPQILMPA